MSSTNFSVRSLFVRGRRILVFLPALLLLTAGLARVEAASGPQGKRSVSRSASRTSSKQAHSTTRNSRKPPRQRMAREGFEFKELENSSARRNWFFDQRAYPFNDIPAGARRKAWESMPRERFAPNVPTPTWVSIGPRPTLATEDIRDAWGLLAGRINTIAVSPADPNLILIGGASGGVWRSTDGGVNFVPVSDNQVDLSVGWIAFAPSNPSIVYAGMGDYDNFYVGTGVLKSTDAGRTWKRVSNSTLTESGFIVKVLVDSTDPNRVYVAQVERRSGNSTTASGFWVSTDGGVNWKRTFSGFATDAALSTADAKTVFLAMDPVSDPAGSDPGLYKSIDGGTTWTLAYKPSYDFLIDSRVGTTPADPKAVYFYSGGAKRNELSLDLARSTDGGAIWTSRSTPDDFQFGYNTYLAVDPKDARTLYLGTVDVFKTTDAGESFANLTDVYGRNSNTHPDQQSFAFVPDGFLIGNDGGLFKSTNGGKSFQSLNATLSLTQFVGLALHPTNANISYAGAQDNGTQRRTSTPGVWEDFPSGDGGNCVVNAADPSIVYTSYFFAQLLRWRDNGDTFDKQIGRNTTFGESNGNPRMSFYPPFVGNGVNSTLYFGTWRLFVSKNLGDTWTPPAGTLDLTKGNVGGRLDYLNAIAVSRSDVNVIYTGSRFGRVMRTQNEGQTWTDITTGLPDRAVGGIAVHPTDPTTAFVVMSGFGTGHVFRTTNSGGSWTDVGAGLPDIPFNAALFDPTNPSTIYVASDIGIFRSTNNGASWEAFNRGLPPTPVTALAAQPSGLIQAATYGRGAYELRIVDVTDDKTPPTVTLMSPVGGETIESATSFRIAWTSSDDRGVASHDIALSVDGGRTFPTPVATGLDGTAQGFTWTVPIAATPTARIRVTATDEAGNGGSDASRTDFQIVVTTTDTTAPAVNVTAPAAGLTVESTDNARVSVAWTATDNVGVVNQAVKFTGKRNGQGFTETAASGLPASATSFSLTIRKDDAVTEAQVIVEATDAAKNVGAGRSGLFTVRPPQPADTQKPVVSDVTLSKTTVKRKKDPLLTITWKSSDNVGVTGHAVVYATDGTTFSRTVTSGLPGNTLSFAWTVPNDLAKTKTGKVKVTATDAAGNTGEAVSASFVLK